MGRAVGGAEVDVWHASTDGYYENQDPAQADMNLRGKFTTDAEGIVRFRSVKPSGYPIRERSGRRPIARAGTPQTSARLTCTS